MFRRVFRLSLGQQQKSDLAKSHQERSIGIRLRWSYLISSTLPLIVVGTLLTVLNFLSQRQTVYNEQIMLSMQAVRQIARYISDIEVQILSVVQSMPPEATPEQWETATRGLIVLKSPDLRQVAVYDQEANEIVNLSAERTFTPDTFVRRTEDPMVLQALNGSGSRSAIYRADDGQMAFAVVLPLRNNAYETVGAIRAEISAAPIAHVLRLLDIQSDSVAFLVHDASTIMLESSNPEWSPPLNLATLLDSKTIEYERESSKVLIYRNQTNKAMLGVVTTINPSGWYVVVEQPLRQAFGNVWMNVLLLTTLVALVGLMGLGWGLFEANQIIRPVKILREGALTLGTGRLDHRIEVGSADELGQLAHSFNQMADRLQASLSEIEQQNEHLREGLKLARDIQMGLLPDHPPWSNNVLHVQGCSLPASEVGGDFYSYHAFPEGQAAISIGDISGKGVGAALMMALTSSMVESQARQYIYPSETLAALNRLLSPRLKANHMNAALLYALFDFDEKTMTVANAGMIAPLIIRQQQQCVLETVHPVVFEAEHNTQHVICQFIDVGGLPIGSLPNTLYKSMQVPLEPDDIVIFMSDGVIEAHNAQGEMFGFERLEALVTNMHAHAHAHTFDHVHTVVTFILETVQDFIGQAEQHDDITIVAVRPAQGVEHGIWNINPATADTLTML